MEGNQELYSSCRLKEHLLHWSQAQRMQMAALGVAGEVDGPHWENEALLLLTAVGNPGHLP